MAAAPLTFRPVDPDDDTELDTWMSSTALVFTVPFRHTAERRDALRPRFRDQRLSAAFDGDHLVATYRSWDWQLSVPGGGTVTADAVSSVTVRPTHRRRGALTGLITADLADAATRGLPVAVLIASEAGIYGRFGFGPAVETATWEVDLRAARIAPGVPKEGDLRIVEPPRLRPIAPAVYEAARRPGATDRGDLWWDIRTELFRVPGEPEHAPVHGVVHRSPTGEPEGYLLYSTKDDWHERTCRTVAQVHDFQAATPRAYAALWDFLVGLDLVATVRAEDRPVDEPLPWLLTDARAARRTASCDLLWTRLLDPAAALSARRYETAGHAVLEVTDPLGHAAGRFALDVADDGTGKATPTGADADLTLPVEVLSSLWLGAGDLHAAALAGRVREHTPRAVPRLARLLRTTRAPWTNTWF